MGGDSRISLDPLLGRNRYACCPRPEPEIAAFGSSTASSISVAGFQAADRLRCRIEVELGCRGASAVYAHELSRVRRELVQLCGLADLAGLESVFSSSGTDAHLIATQLVAEGGESPLLVIMMEGDETGKGVPAALNGRHFSSRSALGLTFLEGAPLAGAKTVEVAPVPLRSGDGTPRLADAIHRDVDSLTSLAVKQGQRVLLILLDQSKTGLIAPSPAFAEALRHRFPDRVDLLVDGCQFRLAPSTLRGYLEKGFMVALTGSKFLTGPAFSGLLFIPSGLTHRLSRCRLPGALSAYSARADWPGSWAATAVLDDVANFGLLLRWEAALAELRAFSILSQVEIRGFLEEFARGVQGRLADDPLFDPLPAPGLERGSVGDPASWDSVPTVFPFLLRRPGRGNLRGALLNGDETSEIYRLLQRDLSGSGVAPLTSGGMDAAVLRCQLGQPAACGTRDGIALSALRICASSRLVVEAVATGDSAGILRRVTAALDKTAWLLYTT